MTRPTPLPLTPRHGHAAKRGYGPQRRYTPRCATCEGRGYITGLDGLRIDCPRCINLALALGKPVDGAA